MTWLKRSTAIILLFLYTNALAEIQEYDFSEVARQTTWNNAIFDERSIFTSVSKLDAEDLVEEDWPESLTSLVQSDLWSDTLTAANDLSAEVTQTVRVLSPSDVADTYWTDLKLLYSDMSKITSKILFLSSDLESILFTFELAEAYDYDPDAYAAELEKAEAEVDDLEAELEAMQNQIDAIETRLEEMTPTE